MKFKTSPSIGLIDYMGNDLNIVNAARVSFDKVSNKFSDKDEKLLKYLAEHKHWSPFAHTSLSFRCEAPIFLARQLVKHQVGGVWNEVSRRYVDYEPTFYIPSLLHERAENAKQGCGLGITNPHYYEIVSSQTKDALATYEYLIGEGIAPEEARMILPLNTMTEWIWTGSLMFFHRVWALRSEAHAQTIAREFAEALDQEIACSPYAKSWEVLKEYYA